MYTAYALSVMRHIDDDDTQPKIKIQLVYKNPRATVGFTSFRANLPQTWCAGGICGFDHLTSTGFRVYFGNVFAKVSPREVLRLLPR